MTWLARANLLRVLRLFAVVSATTAVLAFLAAALPPLSVALLPTSLALRGSLEEAVGNEGQTGAPDRRLQWSFVGQRQGHALHGKWLILGHPSWNSLAVEAAVLPEVVEGLLMGAGGEVVGKLSGRWSTSGAEGTYELLSGEAGSWNWPSAAPDTPPTAEKEPALA